MHLCVPLTNQHGAEHPAAARGTAAEGGSRSEQTLSHRDDLIPRSWFQRPSLLARVLDSLSMSPGNQDTPWKQSIFEVAKSMCHKEKLVGIVSNVYRSVLRSSVLVVHISEIIAF